MEKYYQLEVFKNEFVKKPNVIINFLGFRQMSKIQEEYKVKIDIDGDIVSDERITKNSTHIVSESEDLDFYVTDLKDIATEYDDFSFLKINQ